MTWCVKAAGAIILATASMSASLEPAHANRILRAAFYENTGLGSLAFLPNSKTEPTARGELAVVDLTDKSCIKLPPTGHQWFLINHHDEGLQGKVGYFSVRILYYFAGERPEGERFYMQLQRNANWFDDQGRQSVDPFGWSSEQSEMTPQTFVRLHDIASADADERYKELQSWVGDWHMRPEPEGQSSWRDRYLYGSVLVGNTIGAISVRLMRFTATAGTWTRNPVVFWLDPRGAKSATILINAPQHPGVFAQRYSVRFEEACP